MSETKFDIGFYETRSGERPAWDFLETLRIKTASSKDARIQYRQAIMYIDLLAMNGTNLSENITKHLEEDIWELRPGNTEFFTSSSKEKPMTKKTLMFCFISFARSRRRLPAGKLNKQSVNAMTTCPERRTVNYEDLERLQGTRQGC